MSTKGDQVISGLPPIKLMSSLAIYVEAGVICIISPDLKAKFFSEKLV